MISKEAHRGLMKWVSIAPFTRFKSFNPIFPKHANFMDNTGVYFALTPAKKGWGCYRCWLSQIGS